MRNIFILFSLIFFIFSKSQVSFNQSEVLNGVTYNFEYYKSVGDIDNDGYPEIFIITDNYFTPHEDFNYLINVNGDLNYFERVNIDIESDVGFDFLYDIDNDGLIDIVGVNGSRHYYWLKNLGNHNFSDAWQSIVVSNIDYFSSDIFYDYNNDNFVDYFVTTTQGEVFRYTNLQGNGFSSPELVFYTDDTFLGHIEQIKFLDFNQDGFEDLLVRSFFTDFDLYLNNGNDHFEYHIPIENQANENYLDSFDFDGNSLNDFVIYNENSLKIRTFFYDDGAEEYYSHDELIDNPFTHISSNIFVISRIVDFNQDGLMDIFITTGPDESTYANLYYYENLGNQEFAEKQLIKENLYGHFEFIFTDLNSDDELDILMVNKNHIYPIYALYNEGNLNFKEEIVEQNLRTSDKTFFVDINNDGKTDIINGKSNLIWYENRGENDWSGRRFIPSLNREIPLYKDYVVLDINNDNLPDVIKNEFIEENNVSNTFSIFKNLGNLEFERIYYLENDYQNRWYHYETYKNENSDFPDVYFLMPDWSPNPESSIYIMKNNDGVFEEPVQAVIQSDGILFNPNNYDFDLADLNNDGLPEIIYFNLYYDDDDGVINQFSYLENLGNDTFSKNTIDALPQNIGDQTFPIDYDLDGDQDIIVGNDQYGIRDFSVYENENMIFTKKLIDDNVIVDDVLVHDINNDGLQDIMTLGYYGWNEPEYSYKYVIFYYENLGNGQYEKFLINQFESYFNNENTIDRGNIYLYDKNLDGDLDLLASCSDDNNTILFFLNTSNLEVEDLDSSKNQTQVYPNPFSEVINWKSIQQKDIYNVSIFDLTGKSLFDKNINSTHLDLNFLEKGIYILKIDEESFKVIKK